MPAQTSVDVDHRQPVFAWVVHHRTLPGQRQHGDFRWHWTKHTGLTAGGAAKTFVQGVQSMRVEIHHLKVHFTNAVAHDEEASRFQHTGAGNVATALNLKTIFHFTEGLGP